MLSYFRDVHRKVNKSSKQLVVFHFGYLFTSAYCVPNTWLSHPKTLCQIGATYPQFDFSLTSSIQTIKTKVKVSCLMFQSLSNQCSSSFRNEINHFSAFKFATCKAESITWPVLKICFSINHFENCFSGQNNRNL